MPADTLIPNAIVLTNWVTQTNAISAWNDPQLWVTGLGAALTFGTALIMLCSVLEMRKQSNISKKSIEKMTIQAEIGRVVDLYDQFQDNMLQYNLIPPKEPLKRIILISQKGNLCMKAVHIYYVLQSEKSKNLFYETINIHFSLYLQHHMASLLESFSPDPLIIKYCKENNLDIPKELQKGHPQ